MAWPRLELLARYAAALFVENLRIARWQRELIYEKNRNPFWTGRQLPAGVCRASKPENRRQGDHGRVRQDGQSRPGRAVRLRRGDRPDFAGRAVLSGVAQERGAHRHRGRKQSVLVERRRKVLQ